MLYIPVKHEVCGRLVLRIARNKAGVHCVYRCCGTGQLYPARVRYINRLHRRRISLIRGKLGRLLWRPALRQVKVGGWHFLRLCDKWGNSLTRRLHADGVKERGRRLSELRDRRDSWIPRGIQQGLFDGGIYRRGRGNRLGRGGDSLLNQARGYATKIEPAKVETRQIEVSELIHHIPPSGIIGAGGGVGAAGAGAGVAAAAAAAR